MKYLEIKSKGEMEIQAISLIGASTKRGDPNSIGMFGSGLKYAVASILRQEIPFAVFSGEREIRITTKEVVFGNKTFNQIYINGEQTSLTDTMGTEDWAGIFPFVREIYSNALDEDEDATIKIVDTFKQEPGFTTYYIEATEDVEKFMKNFDNYFVYTKDSIWANDKGEIHRRKEGTKVFRKGILAHCDNHKESLFSYNCYDITINESRVISNRYEVQRIVATLLESCTNPRILRLWINGISTAEEQIYEHDCILDDWYQTSINAVLPDVILENKYYPISLRNSGLLEQEDMKGRVGLPLDLLKRFIKYAPDIDILGFTSENDDKKTSMEKKPSDELVLKVSESLAELNQTSYGKRLVNEIKYCAFVDKLVLGNARKNVIWLSIKLDTYSVAEISKIIIEEQEHLHSGFIDESRAFQNHLFNLFYNELKR